MLLLPELISLVVNTQHHITCRYNSHNLHEVSCDFCYKSLTQIVAQVGHPLFHFVQAYIRTSLHNRHNLKLFRVQESLPSIFLWFKILLCSLSKTTDAISNSPAKQWWEVDILKWGRFYIKTLQKNIYIYEQFLGVTGMREKYNVRVRARKKIKGIICCIKKC